MGCVFVCVCVRGGRGAGGTKTGCKGLTQKQGTFMHLVIRKREQGGELINEIFLTDTG